MRSLVLLFLSCRSCALNTVAAKWDNFQFNFEVRSREEARTAVTFGRDPNLENPLFRTRSAPVGAAAVAEAVGDGPGFARAEYGAGATSARDSMDCTRLHRALPARGEKASERFLAGRWSVLGEGRLVGVPQWPTPRRTSIRRAYITGPHARWNSCCSRL